MSIFDESRGTINLGMSMPELSAYSDTEDNQAKTDLQTGRVIKGGIDIGANNYKDYDILVMGNTAQIVDRGRVGSIAWDQVIDPHPGVYRAGLSQLQIKRKLLTGETGTISINGGITINELDRTKLQIVWDEDTIPTNSSLNLSLIHISEPTRPY